MDHQLTVVFALLLWELACDICLESLIQRSINQATLFLFLFHLESMRWNHVILGSKTSFNKHKIYQNIQKVLCTLVKCEQILEYKC